MEVWTIDLNQPEPFILAANELLTSDEMGRANKFTNAHARRNHVVTRSVLRVLLATKLEIKPEEIPLCVGPYGKPELAGKLKGRLHFNLSHSGKVGLIALSPDTEVGVDIEHVRPMPQATRLAQRFFTSTEAAALRQFPEWERDVSFLRIWTRKEALLKATGAGIAGGLARLEVTCEDNGRLIALDGKQDYAAKWTLHSWCPVEDYLATVAVPSPDPLITFHEFGFGNWLSNNA